MEVRVLGDVELVRDGVPVVLGGPKPRALVALLVAARGNPVGTERIIDQLWGDEPPAKVVTALHANVAKLRRQLEPDRGPRRHAEVLVTRHSGYALVLADDAVDAQRFEGLLARSAREADPDVAERLLVEALALWRGPAYGGTGNTPALLSEAARLEELRLSALEQLWGLRVDRDDPGDAAAELSNLVDEHPLRERLWALLARALYRSGRQADALEALRWVRRHLADELGIDPGPELQQLEQAVLRQDAQLSVRTGRTPAAAPAPPAVVPTERTLPGREDLLRRTGDVVSQAAAGRGRVLLVTGEPGVGKTSAGDAIATQAEAAGLRTVRGTWESEGCPPLWGWSQALAGVGSGRFGETTDDTDTASTIFRLADLALAELTRDGGACVVLDDVQWADADSQRLLGRFASLVADASVLLVVLCRDPLPEPAESTHAMLAALARTDPLRLPLTGLSAPAVRELVHQRTGRLVDDEVAARVRERTDGNPFFVNELVRLLSEEGVIADLTSPAWGTVPAGVRDVVRHRLGELPPTVAEVLSVASVLGRSFDLDVLEESWAQDPVALDDALETAMAAGLVVEEEIGRCRFAHALVRDTVYADLPATSRRRAHARAAEALERRRVGHLDEHASQLADHYRLGGPAHSRSAWTYAVRAAHVAAGRGAHEDAARLLTSAVELQRSDALVDPREVEQVQVELGVALRQSARSPQAWAPLAAAAESALRRGDGRAAATALLSITENVLWSWRELPMVHPDGVDLWQRVLAALAPEDAALRALCQASLAVELIHAPPGSVDDLADQAVHTARVLGDEAVLRHVLHVVVNAMQSPDLMVRRAALVDELVVRCARIGDEPALALALVKRAANHSALARPHDARQDLLRAGALAERHHLATALMVVNYALGVVHQAAGELEESERVLQRAESIQQTITMAGEGIGISQRATMLYVLGRLPEMAETLDVVGPQHYLLRELQALCSASAGDLATLAARLGPWSEQPELPWDYGWLSLTAVRGLVWAALADAEAVRDLRAQLAPYADRIADGASAAFFLGSVHHTLGELALAAGDLDDARAHAEAAVAVHHRLGWPLWARKSEDLRDRVGAAPAR